MTNEFSIDRPTKNYPHSDSVYTHEIPQPTMVDGMTDQEINDFIGKTIVFPNPIIASLEENEETKTVTVTLFDGAVISINYANVKDMDNHYNIICDQVFNRTFLNEVISTMAMADYDEDENA